MIKRLLIAVAMLCAVSGAQVPVTPIVQPHMTFVDAAGNVCAGCKVFTYTAGTTTPFPTYTDSVGVSQNTNPIILGADGGPATPSGSSGGIWFGRHSYKLILKDALGNTIWTVDNVNAATLFPCGPANTVQIANSGVTGLNCDPNIFEDPINHTFNVGILSVNHVVIGALGTPTSWTFDTTTPATACASLGCGTTTGTVTSVSVTAANGVSGTVATPTTTPAITLTLGAITPASVQLASGTPITGNQGTGVKVQHSTGTTTTDNCAKFDATGNTVDAGFTCVAATPRTCNANGCYRIESDGTIEEWGISSAVPTGADAATVTVTFPFPFTTTTNLSYVAWADSCATTPCNTSNKNPLALSGDGTGISTTGVTNFLAGVVPTGGGGVVLGSTIRVHWHALGN